MLSLKVCFEVGEVIFLPTIELFGIDSKEAEISKRWLGIENLFKRKIDKLEQRTSNRNLSAEKKCLEAAATGEILDNLL